MTKKILSSLILFCLILALSPIIFWAAITRPFIFFPQAIELTVSAKPEVLEQHTKKLSQDFLPRDWKHPQNLDQVAQYIHDTFNKHKARTSLQTFNAGVNEYSNVIAEFGAREGPITIVGAHYDSYEALPGADDNASGIAGLLELSRLLGTTSPSKRIMLVAYTLEEPPFFDTEFMGSVVHARSIIEASETVALMISLEMIGYFSKEKNSQQAPHYLLGFLYPSRGDFITVIGEMDEFTHTLAVKRAIKEVTDLPVYSVNAPTFIPGIDFSDHRSYWRHGIPAVMVTDTAFFRNRHYHTAEDTVDRLDFQQMSKVVLGIYHYLTSTDQTE